MPRFKKKYKLIPVIIEILRSLLTFYPNNFPQQNHIEMTNFIQNSHFIVIYDR